MSDPRDRPARSPLPLPGRRMLFVEWATVLTKRVRSFIPDVAAVRRGEASAVLHYQARRVTLIDDRGTFWIQFADDAGATTMANLFDGQRHDEFTARNFAKTIAGFFDGTFSTPD